MNPPALCQLAAAYSQDRNKRGCAGMLDGAVTLVSPWFRISSGCASLKCRNLARWPAMLPQAVGWLLSLWAHQYIG